MVRGHVGWWQYHIPHRRWTRQYHRSVCRHLILIASYIALFFHLCTKTEAIRCYKNIKSNIYNIWLSCLKLNSCWQQKHWPKGEIFNNLPVSKYIYSDLFGDDLVKAINQIICGILAILLILSLSFLAAATGKPSLLVPELILVFPAFFQHFHSITHQA